MTGIDADIVMVSPVEPHDNSMPSTQKPEEAATSQDTQPQDQFGTKPPRQDNVSQLSNLITNTSISTSSRPKKMKETKNIFIAVMGMTGSGKTTFISKLTGRDLKIGHKLESCTQNIEVIDTKIGDYTVHVIDTPGFSDTHRSDTEILETIAEYLGVAYSKKMRLSGIIYLHPISDNRVTHQSVNNLNMFQKLIGEDNLKNVLLVTSMWDKVSVKEGTEREQELRTNFWKLLIAFRAQVTRYACTTESAQRVVSMLIGNNPFYAQLQEEVGRDKKALKDTAAGVEVVAELSRLKDQHRIELENMKKMMLETSTQQNEVAAAVIKEQYQKLIEDLEKIRADEKRMHEEAVRSLNARISELESRGPCTVM